MGGGLINFLNPEKRGDLLEAGGLNKTVLDSGFQVLDSGIRVSGTRFSDYNH